MRPASKERQRPKSGVGRHCHQKAPNASSVATNAPLWDSLFACTWSHLRPLAILNGGPMDGREQTIEDDTDELSVVMTDGQQHRYLRSNDVRPRPDGRLITVFDWVGRYYGPK